MLLKNNQQYLNNLEKNRNTIESRNGGWYPGKGVFVHGYQLLEDLVINNSYMQIVILNATGRLVERKLADWMETISGCMSWPDARIWCNKIGAFAGETQTTVSAATVAGVLAGDSRIYAQGTLTRGMDFLTNSRSKQLQGKSVAEITDDEIKANFGKPYIMGFARPLAHGDERVIALEQVTKKLGFEIGPHMQLAYDIEAILMQRFGESMNIVGYMSGFLADHGFSAEEVCRIFSMSIMSGVTACYVEYCDRPANSFLPLRCDDIEYVGKPIRQVNGNAVSS